MARKKSKSPQWSPTTKLVAGLTLVAIVAALLVRFNNLIGPLLVAFVISYLLHPFITRLSSGPEISWRLAVNLIFLAFLVVLTVFMVVAGLAIVDQFQSLVVVLQNFATTLPTLLDNLSTQVFVVGPLQFDLSELETFVNQQLGLDFLTLGEQAFGALQPVLGSAGGILGRVAGSALSFFVWGAFVMTISYFTLAEAGQVPQFFSKIDLVDNPDMERLGQELGKVWNAFIRGQILIFTLLVASSFLVLTMLGVRNSLGLAFLIGLAKFVPYVGPLVSGITTAVVAFFQGSNYLGIEPALVFAIVVVLATIILDQVFDTLVVPRVFSESLGVHPAALLVAALIAANLLGLIGLLLAAPVLASMQLFFMYTARKMLDLDPWPEEKPDKKDEGPKLPLFARLRAGLRRLVPRRKK